jgi:hypothetical protein
MRTNITAIVAAMIDSHVLGLAQTRNPLDGLGGIMQLMEARNGVVFPAVPATGSYRYRYRGPAASMIRTLRSFGLGRRGEWKLLKC